MLSYILRRFLYAIPILFGVNFIVFILFFFINTPNDMARLHLGEKNSTPEQISRWKYQHNLHLPYFINFGWKQIALLSAKQKRNQLKILLPSGKYRLKLTASQNVFLACKKTLSLQFTNPMEEGPLSKTIYLSKNKTNKEWSFEVLPNTNNHLIIDFMAQIPSIFHYVTLEIQDSLTWYEQFTQTIFFNKSLQMIFFQYGKSEDGQSILSNLANRLWPSLSITVPAFILGLFINIMLGMLLALYHKSLMDEIIMLCMIISMSISILFYIIFLQFVFSTWLNWFPISGFLFDFNVLRFVSLPIIIAIIGSLGGNVRFYKTIFLEEINKDYITTAKSKGLPPHRIWFVHLLKNAMLPILTSVVVQIPFLFMGSLVLESFFSIPGLGSYLIEAIYRQDFTIVQSMVSIGSFLYIIGLLLTDISYSIVDPRVKFS